MSRNLFKEIIRGMDKYLCARVITVKKYVQPLGTS